MACVADDPAFCQFGAMPKPFPHAYTCNHVVSDDGHVTFECSQDTEIWPWLALSPIHPILVQTINFWGSVEAGEALGTFDPEKWSALTFAEWSCGPASVGRPVRGIYETLQRGEETRFQLRFYDADYQQTVRISGKGVVFRTRNFEGWRRETKDEFKKPDTSGFEYAAAEMLGVATDRERFLAPLVSGSAVTTQGLITKENGLRPAHPYIGGSGDHVNSTHMGEIGRQFAEMLFGRRLHNRTGEMSFMHYVELGRPFEVELVSRDADELSLSLLVTQRDRDCARIEMAFAPA